MLSSLFTKLTVYKQFKSWTMLPESSFTLALVGALLLFMVILIALFFFVFLRLNRLNLFHTTPKDVEKGPNRSPISPNSQAYKHFSRKQLPPLPEGGKPASVNHIVEQTLT
jgi:hypothetical protein